MGGVITTSQQSSGKVFQSLGWLVHTPVIHDDRLTVIKLFSNTLERLHFQCPWATLQAM
ncbi:hypothetical protein HAALTHF_05710n [Vreelandella aquamarina]|nr:hypothetical protein HAALTHF_05710n [Halomonas axialensis]